MAERLVCRKRTTYNTVSNRKRKVRTPGNRLVYQRIKKCVGVPRCPISGAILNGLPTSTKRVVKGSAKHERSVSRPYGGCLSHKVVKDRILKALLSEEKKCVIAMIKSNASKLNKSKRAAK